MRWIESGVRSSWLVRSISRRSRSTDSSIRSSIRLSVCPRRAISSRPLVKVSRLPDPVSEMPAACRRMCSTGRSAAARASHDPTQSKQTAAMPLIASVAASWVISSRRSCSDTPTRTSTGPRDVSTGTSRILAMLSISGIFRSNNCARAADLACVAGIRRCPARTGLERMMRPPGLVICAKTSSPSMRVGLMGLTGSPCCTLAASTSARDLSPASIVLSRSAPVREYTNTLSPAITHATLTENAAVTHNLIGIWILRVISDSVACAADRVERRPSERAVDLLAQRAHIDVHATRIAIVSLVPDVTYQLQPGQDLTGVPHEVFEQRELSSGQADLGVAAPYLMGGRVQC